MVAGSLNLVPFIVLFSLILKHVIYFNVRTRWLQCCRTCCLDLRILHPQQLRACAEPRWASARRGESGWYAVLSCCMTYYIAGMYLYITIAAAAAGAAALGVVAAAAAVVRQRGPGGIKCCWFIESDSIR